MAKDNFDDVILSENERAALAEFDDDELDDMYEAADDGEGADDDEGEAEQAKKADAESTDAKKQDEEAEQKATDAVLDEHDPEPKSFAYQPSEDATQLEEDNKKIADRLKAIDDELDDLANQFDDGDLDSAEYRKANKALQAEARELSVKSAANEAEARARKTHEKQQAEQAQQYSQAKWEAAVEHWAAQGDNAKYNTNPVLVQYMITAVQQLRETKEGAELSNLAALKKARDNVDNMLREAGFLPAKEANKAGKKPEKPKPTMPPNLGDVPAAGRNDSGDEFAYLDNLSGSKLENAVARMSPAQRERWLTH